MVMKEERMKEAEFGSERTKTVRFVL
jgi:hypothetical protein